MFVTGKNSEVFVLDYDRKNIRCSHHINKIDGIEFHEDWFGSFDTTDTLTTRTISGGYHKVYKYTEELWGKIRSGQLTAFALIDVLCDGRGFTFGEGYQIINKVEPREPSKSVVNFITQNNLTNYGSGSVNQQQIIASALGVPINGGSLSERISKVIGSEGITWRINNLDNAYQLIADTKQCCVDTDHAHTDDNHSSIYVRKTSVVLSCFSHGKRVLQGALSRSIRELFFDLSRSSEGVMVSIVNDIRKMAVNKQLARENNSVIRRVSDTYAYEHVDNYRDFLKRILKDNDAIQERPRRFNDLMIYMSNIDSIDFPFVKRDKRYIGFLNGMLDIVSGELLDNNTLEHGMIPRHYIGQVCDFKNTDTPLFDRILQYQLESDDLCTYMLAFIGRLFYDVRQFDEWDIMPFIIGDTNTGKSTLIDVICAMFSPNGVGVLDSSHEMVFGLQSKYNKEVIVAPEVNDRMAQQLASDSFKKMNCGELVNVPIKHSEAISVQWKVPMIMCGNRYINYDSDRGSISKRLAIFKFDRMVIDMDDSLKQKIIDTELSKLVVKSLRAYRTVLKHTGTQGFWNTCPDYFRDTRDEMNQTTDYVHMFLTLGPDENAWSNKIMYFINVKDACMMLEEFKRKFHNYMRFRHPNVRYKWDQDLSAFKRLGYEIVYTKVCRACLNEAKKDCCVNYSNANRSTRRVIRHIMCVEKEIEYR